MSLLFCDGLTPFLLNLHRGKPKPMPKPIDGFSPMSDDQWSELLELVQYGQDVGFKFIWIDWSCVTQYIGNPMTEVLRSKLYYARSTLMVAIPTFCFIDAIPNKGQGIFRQLLASSSKDLSSFFIFASADALMAKTMVEAILAKGRFASQEYFGR